MTPDKSQASSSMTTRQKITIAAFVLIVLVILWQVYSLFGSTSTTPAITPKAANHPVSAMNTGTAMNTASPMPNSPTPQPAQLIKPQPAMVSPEEANMLRMQQQAESQYLSAINQLQMLRIEKDIAETTKAIMSAKLDTVTAQKGIVDLLQPPVPPPTQATYARGLLNQQGGTPTNQVGNVGPASPQTMRTTTIVTSPEVNYTVISVSRLQNRWGAVLGYQGNLFSVAVGDVLPPDGSIVVSIGRTGVLLDKKGVRRKVSLVPII